MRSDERFWLAFWVTAAVVAIFALFTMTGCVKEEAKIDTQVKTACIAKSGNWVDLGRNSYGCQFPK